VPYVSRKATDPHLIRAVLNLEAVEVLSPSGEVLDVVAGWAAARQVIEMHALRATVADLADRLGAIEAGSDEPASSLGL
jgi:hypothetical protein